MLRPIKVSIADNGRHILGEEGQCVSEEEAVSVVEHLAVLNTRAGPVPPFKGAAVKYWPLADCDGFLLATECLRRGLVDATEIVAWRVAELRQSGEDAGARPILRREVLGDGPGYSYYVAKVLRSDGTVEDPVEDLKKRS